MAVRQPARAMPERWQRLTDALSSEWVFRWPTFALYALMGIPFVTVSEFNRLVTPTLPTAIGVATIAVVLTIALIMVIAPFIRTRQRARVPVLIVALVGIGIIRANIVTAIIDGMELNHGSYGLSRAVLSAGAVPSWSLLQPSSLPPSRRGGANVLEPVAPLLTCAQNEMPSWPTLPVRMKLLSASPKVRCDLR